jgi:hypothetical protein
MVAKVGLVIAGTALAMFVMGRFEGLAAHKGFNGPVAYAQESTDPGYDSSSQDGVDSEPDLSVSGIYSGTITDSGEGGGMISAAVTQIHSKVVGTFVATFASADYGPGFVKWKIKNGAIHGRLKFSLRGKCGLNFHGTFQNGDEISGTYQMTGCNGKSNSGSFDMTHP